MKVDFLIIGQGISGTWLSYYLQKEGKSFVIIDKANNNSPSSVSAGIINPVTGRRMVKVWMAEDILPFAWKAYTEIGPELKTGCISQKNLIDFFLFEKSKIPFSINIESLLIKNTIECNLNPNFFRIG